MNCRTKSAVRGSLHRITTPYLQIREAGIDILAYRLHCVGSEVEALERRCRAT
jgi:hypothetical protein